MSTATDKRAAALSSALSTPFFAPTPPRARKRAEKDSLGDMHEKGSKTPHSLVGAPAPWNPVKSPLLRQHGYTMTSHDLQPGMTVTQWPTESSHTIGSVNHLTQDGTQINYTDGREEMVGRNASFTQGIPQQ